MAFIPRSRPASLGFNLTPMIDVVFQLLIFFVCANTWSHAESAEAMALPSPIHSGSQAGEQERPRITINLAPDGRLNIMGRTNSLEQLSRLLQREVQRHGDRLDVALRVDKSVPYGRTQEVLRACSAAGVREVRFAVLKSVR